jgi:GAF domain-containing protein
MTDADALITLEQRRERRNAIIARIGQLMTHASSHRLSAKDFLTDAARAIHDELNYPSVAVFLLDENAPDTLVRHAACGIVAEQVPDPYCQSVHTGLVGTAVQTRHAVRVNDVQNDKRYLAIPANAGVYSECAVPIMTSDGVLGVLDLQSRDAFSDDDVRDAATMAGQLAVAIENARLFEAERQRASRMGIVYRIGRMIAGSLKIDVVLQNAVDAITQHLRYPDVALFLFDEADPDAVVLRARGGTHGGTGTGRYRQHIAEGIIGSAISLRQSVRVDDVRSDPRYVPSVPNVVSELAVPIVVGEQVLGVLNVESAMRIGQDDANDLQIIADQIGVAISHAHSYESERRRNERLALIARTSQRIATRLGPEDLFDTLVRELHEKLGYDHAALFVLDAPEGKDPEFLVQRSCATRWPNSVAIGYRQSIHRGVVGAAARTRSPQRVNDVRSTAHYVSMTNYPSDKEPRAELATPIVLGDRLLGVLDLASDREFGDEDEQAAQIIADQLAVAIDNAELFSATQRSLDETQLLYKTSQRMSVAMGVDDVIDTYLEQVAAQGTYSCSIVTYELDGDGARAMTVMRGRWTPQGGLTHPEDMRIAYVHDALDEALDDGETVTIEDVNTDPRVPARLREIQILQGRPAMAMIPLMVRRAQREERIGQVILTSPKAYRWSEADLRPYQVTAAQLATAMDSRQQQSLLYERGQQVAILEERQRLARELHDSVTQLIFSTTLIAQSISPAFKRNPAEGERRVSRLLELSQTALAEMRALLFELRLPTPTQHTQPTQPAIQQSIVPGLMRLQRDGLAAAIQRYASDVQRDGLQVEIDAKDYPLTNPVLRPPLICEEALYRIAQEALNNVVKHAVAQQVVIRLAVKDRSAHLVVSDNGRGMASLDEAAAGRGIGLKTMRERAEALRGSLSASSASGSGTTIEVMIPL